jgi:preprotein translocase subunit SecG
MVKTFLAVVEVILAVVLMGLVLLQTPKSTGLGGTIGGGGDAGGGYRTKRGLEKTLFQATWGLVALFVVVSILNVRL